LNLKTAVGDGNLTQSLEPESFAMGWSFTIWECPTPLQSNSNSRSCINLPSRTAVSRLKHKHVLNIAFSAVIMGMLASCNIKDPAGSGEVAPWRGAPFKAPAAIAIPDSTTAPNEENIQKSIKTHKGKWQLNELIEIALDNNPATMQAWENAKNAAYLWKASQSTLYPTLLLNEDLQIEKIKGKTSTSTSVISSPTPFNTNSWLISNLSASYLLWDFGGRSASIESTRQTLLAADWTHNQTLQTVILNVMLDYYQHLQAKALVAARSDDLKNAQKNFDAAEGQFIAGVVKKLDVLLARSNLANAKLLLEEQKGLVNTTMGKLANSLGLPANVVVDVEEIAVDANLDEVQENIEELIALAKSQRKDLSAAEATWKSQMANTKVIWSEGMPTLTASGYIEKDHNIHHPTLDSRVGSGMLTLSIPLFNGFYYVNQTKAASAKAASLYADWRSKEENVILDVVTSYYNFQTATEKVKFSQEYYEYTEEAYQIAYLSYKQGVGTILDLLTAQAALSNARAQRIIAKTEWISALTNIAYATGSL